MRITITLVTLFIISCKDDGVKTALDTLPEVTQSGRNTFGFLMNGAVWVQTSDVQATYYNNPAPALKLLTISAGGDISKPEEQLYISAFETEIHEGVYDLNPGAGKIIFFRKKACMYSSEPQQGNVVGIGELTISKFDKTHSIVSGTFRFKSEADGACDSVEIAEGRFDLKFRTIITH